MTKHTVVVGSAGILLAACIAALAIGCGGDSRSPAARPDAIVASATPAAARTAPPTASSSGTAGIDPCALVTRAEAEAAFGFPAQEPAAKGAVCRYDTVQQTKFFDLTARTGTSKDFESAKNLCGSSTAPVPGLGDNSCSTNNTVVVLAKDVLITIIAGGNFNQDNLVAVARTAASRVP
jgi:hypothetical protein